jgi:hypothetical protein
MAFLPKRLVMKRVYNIFNSVTFMVPRIYWNFFWCDNFATCLLKNIDSDPATSNDS